MASENVIPMPGFSLPDPFGEPVPDIVAQLEWALAEAKSGNFRACAIAFVLDDGTQSPHTSYKMCISPGNGRYLENSINRLSRAMGRWLDDL